MRRFLAATAITLGKRAGMVTVMGLAPTLVIAVCTEFACLILLRYREERLRGFGLEEALTLTKARTGRAFACSALTVIIGVGVLATSSLPLLRDFGLIVSMNVVVALLSALVILPPLLLWADERGWVSGRAEVRRPATAPAPAD